MTTKLKNSEKNYGPISTSLPKKKITARTAKISLNPYPKPKDASFAQLKVHNLCLTSQDWRDLRQKGWFLIKDKECMVRLEIIDLDTEEDEYLG